MEATQITNSPSFETFWTGMQELRESQKETDRMIKERAKEFDREMKEAKERADRLDKQLGELGNRFGEMVEYMVVPNLTAKFSELGFEFEKAYRDTVVKDKNNKAVYQVDVTLENGDKVMIVEVKSKPTIADVTEHVERMEKVRAHADRHGDKRKFLGAIAGVAFNDNEKTFAMKNGFYVIEPAGETFAITAPEGIYSPKEW